MRHVLQAVVVWAMCVFATVITSSQLLCRKLFIALFCFLATAELALASASAVGRDWAACFLTLALSAVDVFNILVMVYAENRFALALIDHLRASNGEFISTLDGLSTGSGKAT